MNYLTLDGTKYVVSKEFAAAIQRDLGTLEFNMTALEAERQAIMLRSNFFILTDTEHKRLDALTHVKNVDARIRRIGAHRDPAKDFGLDGWDAATVVDIRPGCGCVHQQVFDYHSCFNHFGHNRLSHEEVAQPDGSIKVVERYKRKHYDIEPLRLCDAHK